MPGGVPAFRASPAAEGQPGATPGPGLDLRVLLVSGLRYGGWPGPDAGGYLLSLAYPAILALELTLSQAGAQGYLEPPSCFL